MNTQPNRRERRVRKTPRDYASIRAGYRRILSTRPMGWVLTALLLGPGLLVGCGSFGFGPGYSMRDPGYFSEFPHIVSRTNGYCLRWRYGTWGFHFRPESKVVDGRLLFALQATSSSGSRRDRYDEMAIVARREIQALENGGAFWLEPNGRKIQLEIKR